MTGTGSHTGTGLGNAIKKGVGMVHGTGEAIRGNFNAAVDEATGDHASAQRHQNVAARGVDEFEHGHYHGTGAGVTPVDTDRERVNRAAQGESATVGSTNYGPHGTNIGNKLDPRIDSDLDNRGAVTGSTNQGPHSTNIGNKVDPRVNDDYPNKQYDGCTEPILPPASSEKTVSSNQILPDHTGVSKNVGTSVQEADSVLRKATESLTSQKTSTQPAEANSKPARRASADAYSSGAEYFGVPKRSGTEPHVALNNLFGASNTRCPRDSKRGFLRGNNPQNDCRSRRRYATSSESSGSGSDSGYEDGEGEGGEGRRRGGAGVSVEGGVELQTFKKHASM